LQPTKINLFFGQIYLFCFFNRFKCGQYLVKSFSCVATLEVFLSAGLLKGDNLSCWTLRQPFFYRMLEEEEENRDNE
jgi:hypothetical protein